MENLFGQKIVNAKKVKNNRSLRCYYDVEYSEKDKVKSLGCKWDKDMKKWYYEVVDIENDENFKSLLKMNYFPYKNYNTHISKEEYDTINIVNGNIEYGCSFCNKQIKEKHLSYNYISDGKRKSCCEGCWEIKHRYCKKCGFDYKLFDRGGALNHSVNCLGHE